MLTVEGPSHGFCYQFVMGTGCVSLITDSSCYDVQFMHDHEDMSRGWKQSHWEPKHLCVGQEFFLSIELCWRLPKEVVLHQSSGVFKTCLNTAPSNLMWTQSWPFFEKEVGLKTSLGFVCILKSCIKTSFVLRKLEAAKQRGVREAMGKRDGERHTRVWCTCCSMGKWHPSRHHAPVAPGWRPRDADCLKTHPSCKRTKPLTKG